MIDLSGIDPSVLRGAQFLGTQQDAAGRVYATWRLRDRDETLLRVRVYPDAAPLVVRLSHVWHLGAETPAVESCGRHACTVCGPQRTNSFSIIN